MTAAFSPDEPDVVRIDVVEAARKLESAHPPLMVDVRTRSEYARELEQIPGSVRVLPDHVGEWLRTAPQERELVFYCS